MKSSAALFLVVVLLVSGAAAKKVDSGNEMAKVKTVVDQFAQAFETEDMELLSRIMAHDPDAVSIGTDLPEYFVGWELALAAARKQSAAYENTKITVKNQAIKVHASGEVAWFSEVWDITLSVGGQPASYKDMRLTGVLENRKGTWVLVQTHASAPVLQSAAPY